MAGFGNHRRELAVLETTTGRIPSIQHNPPSAVQAPSNQIAPWMSANGRDANASPAYGASFYDDSTDPLSHPQPPPGPRGERGDSKQYRIEIEPRRWWHAAE
jgi:adenylate cyclase